LLLYAKNVENNCIEVQFWKATYTFFHPVWLQYQQLGQIARVARFAFLFVLCFSKRRRCMTGTSQVPDEIVNRCSSMSQRWWKQGKVRFAKTEFFNLGKQAFCSARRSGYKASQA
jgi:hypothetical protein